MNIHSFATLVFFCLIGIDARAQDGQNLVKPKSVPEKIAAATKQAPFQNTIEQEYVPVPGTQVLMCRTETTVRSWRAFILETKRDMSGGMIVVAVSADHTDYGLEPDLSASWEKPGFPQTDEHPVVGVNWEDAVAFAKWLSQKEGVRYRLPTDQEWSKAVGVEKYPWGKDKVPPGGAGNYAGEEGKKGMPANFIFIKGYRDEFAHTSPVKSFPANALGIYDLGGNLWEWCEDKYRAAMNDPDVLQKVPFYKDEVTVDGTAFRVLRGSSWYCGETLFLRSSLRASGDPPVRSSNCGFRLVVEASRQDSGSRK